MTAREWEKGVYFGVFVCVCMCVCVSAQRLVADYISVRGVRKTRHSDILAHSLVFQQGSENHSNPFLQRLSANKHCVRVSVCVSSMFEQRVCVVSE